MNPKNIPYNFNNFFKSRFAISQFGLWHMVFFPLLYRPVFLFTSFFSNKILRGKTQTVYTGVTIKHPNCKNWFKSYLTTPLKKRNSINNWLVHQYEENCKINYIEIFSPPFLNNCLSFGHHFELTQYDQNTLYSNQMIFSNLVSGHQSMCINFFSEFESVLLIKRIERKNILNGFINLIAEKVIFQGLLANVSSWGDELGMFTIESTGILGKDELKHLQPQYQKLMELEGESIF